MFVRSVSFLVLLILVTCTSRQQQGKVVVDEIGRTVIVPSQIDRIITLTPALTEMIFALHQDAKLVGITDFCNYPPATHGKERVGTYSTPNIEKIVALKPDLVFASKDGNSKALVDKLTQLGIAVFTISPQNIEQIMETIGRVGSLLQVEAIAESVVTDMQQRFIKVFAHVQGKPKPNVLCVIGEKPLFVVGPGSFPHDIITRAGGRLCTDDAKVKYPQYSMEEVLLRNPEIIIKTTMLAPQSGDDAFSMWRQWTQMRAVKNNRLYIINADILLRPGPRVIDGVEYVAALLQAYQK